MSAKQGNGRPKNMTRRLLKTVAAAVAAVAAGGAYAHWVEPTWVEVTETDIPVPNLPPAWDGVRLAQISDLHCGPWVPLKYLQACIRRVNDLGPDLVAATGDFVTLRQEQGYTDAAAGMLKDLRPTLGTFACLGNHDYGACLVSEAPACIALDLAVAGTQVQVLRNTTARLTRGGQDLWIVGLEDVWAGEFNPKAATATLPRGAASIALCHNPDVADLLAEAGCGAILSGHTHGGQVDLPLIGPPYLPVSIRHRYRGLHAVGRSWLYINRGLGWLWVRARILCRPEIAVLTLRRAGAQ